MGHVTYVPNEPNYKVQISKGPPRKCEAYVSYQDIGKLPGGTLRQDFSSFLWSYRDYYYDYDYDDYYYYLVPKCPKAETPNLKPCKPKPPPPLHRLYLNEKAFNDACKYDFVGPSIKPLTLLLRFRAV